MASQPPSDPATAQLVCRAQAVVGLTETERQQLLELMSSHFDNVRPDEFFRDLNEKAWVVLVTDSVSGRVRGFATLTRVETMSHGQPIVAIYAGDTVMEPECWGQYGWVQAWSRKAFEIAEAEPEKRFFFVLLTATHRTYRFLPGFFREFYPHPRIATPPEMAAARDAIVRLKFPDEYDPQSGVVQLHDPIPVRPQRLDPAAVDRAEEDEYTQFFVTQNPGYANGDFLACIVEYSRANLTPLGRRVTGLYANERRRAARPE